MSNAILAGLRGRTLQEIARLSLINVRHAGRSLLGSGRAAWAADLAFDRRWGTDTSTGMSVRQLGFDAAQISECRRYDPSDEAMLRDPLAALGIDPGVYDFIDYGAGKGRAMMLAMALGFRSVAGIELSDMLCGIARANIARFAGRSGCTVPASVTCADATTFAPAGNHILAYFYNPFGATIMAEVRVRLEAALAAGTASVTVVYANPEREAVFGDATGWRKGPDVRGVAIFLAG